MGNLLYIIAVILIIGWLIGLVGYGAGVALGPDGRLAIGSSPFLGFFVPVLFRPPPAAGPPVVPGKVIVFDPAD